MGQGVITRAGPVLTARLLLGEQVEGITHCALGEPNTFTPAPLTLGRRVGRFYPVLSGLKEGDSYVAKGSFLLKAELSKEGVAHEH